MLNKLGNDTFCVDCSQAEEWSLVMFGITVCSGALVPYGRIALRAGWSKIWSGEEGLLDHLRSFKSPNVS